MFLEENKYSSLFYFLIISHYTVIVLLHFKIFEKARFWIFRYLKHSPYQTFSPVPWRIKIADVDCSPLVFQKKGCFNFRKHLSIRVSKKQMIRKLFHASDETFMFCRPSWKFSKILLKQLLCKEPFSVCSCKKELRSRRCLRMFPEF